MIPRRAISCRTLVVLGVGALLALGLTLSACAAPSATAATDRPEALLVAKLLQLRMSRSRDPSAYRIFFSTGSGTPHLLAEVAAREASSTTPPLPQWDPPYVSSATSSTTDVTVVWKASDAFPGHAAATVFTLLRSQDRWVIVNAREVADAARVPKPIGSP